VLNNPVRYNDPSGHMCSDPEDPTPTCDGSGDTRSGDHIIPGRSTYGDLSDYVRSKTEGYTEEERSIITDMLRMHDDDATQTAQHIIEHRIHISIEPIDNVGAFWTLDNRVVVNESNNYLWQLSMIIHETHHLSQPLLYRLTVVGELEAWQKQLGFYKRNSIHHVVYYGEYGEDILRYHLWEAVLPISRSIIRDKMRICSPGYNSQLLLPWGTTDIYYMVYVYFLRP